MATDTHHLIDTARPGQVADTDERSLEDALGPSEKWPAAWHELLETWPRECPADLAAALAGRGGAR